MRKVLVKSLLCASVAIGMTGRAVADSADFVGGLVGGMIGAAIMQGQNNQSQQRSNRTQRAVSGPSAAERAANVEVQTALNHFAFPVGKPDGVIGPRSRAAISEFQALLAFPATGQLTEMERQILLSAHQRSLMGGPEVVKIVTTDPLEQRGLLVAQRNLLLGTGPARMAGGYGGLPPEIAAAVDEVARNSGLESSQLVQRAGFIQLADMNSDGRSDYLLDTSVTGSGFWCTGDACAVRIFLTTPDGFSRNDFQVADPTPAAFVCLGAACRLDETVLAAQAAPGTVAPAPVPEAVAPAPDAGTTMVAAEPSPALPSFAAAIVVPMVSYADHCKAVSEAMVQRGAMLEVSEALRQPEQALGEQFCRVADAARADGAGLMQQVQGFTEAQIAEQCRGFAAALEPRIVALEGEARDNALAGLQAWLVNAGMPQDQLASTARICLSVGYAGNDARMALGSALVMAGTGNMIYAELVGHHLASGVGIARDPERAIDWFAGASEAVKAGQGPVFLPAEADRMLLVERAAAAVAGRASAPPLLPVTPATVPASAAGNP